MSAAAMVVQAAASRRSRAVLLVLATSGTSWMLACITPLAALAAVAARAFPGREAAAVVAALWLLSQAVGYLVLGYPRTLDSFGWGVAIGLAALLALAAARAVLHWLRRRSPALAAAAGFLAALATHQGGLFAASFVLPSGPEAFAPAVLLQVLQVNALAFAALSLLEVAAVRLGRGLAPSARGQLARA